MADSFSVRPLYPLYSEAGKDESKGNADKIQGRNERPHGKAHIDILLFQARQNVLFVQRNQTRKQHYLNARHAEVSSHMQATEPKQFHILSDIVDVSYDKSRECTFEVRFRKGDSWLLAADSLVRRERRGRKRGRTSVRNFRKTRSVGWKL